MTADAVAELTEFCYRGLNSKNNVINVFIDMRKAFDTLNHRILIKKLDAIGIRGLISK